MKQTAAVGGAASAQHHPAGFGHGTQSNVALVELPYYFQMNRVSSHIDGTLTSGSYLYPSRRP
jgi:hypothetical protein